MELKAEIQNKIYEKLNGLRNKIPLHFVNIGIFELVASTIGIDKLECILNDDKLLQRFTETWSLFLPLYAMEFINSLAQALKPNNHLDPYLTIASPCIYYNFGKTQAYCNNNDDFDLIQKTLFKSSNSIQLGDSLKTMDKIKPQFDLITCLPPFNCMKELKEINGKRISINLGERLLLQSSQLLNENGKSIFLMPPSFLFNKIKEIIHDSDLFIDAVFTLPSGALLPYTNISSILVVITRQKKDKTFIAEIINNKQSNNIVMDNYINRSEGKVIQLGGLVNVLDFISMQSLISQRELSNLTKQIGYPSIKLKDVAHNIAALKDISSDEVQHYSNTIYIPKVGNSRVVTNPNDMKIKPKNYFQIQLDELKANATYVSNYFNNEIGKKLRDSLETGSVIRFIPKNNLESCDIHLPNLNTQLELVNIDSLIEQFALRLGDLKRNLWKYPKSYKTIAKELDNLNNTDKMEYWIDTLPFPLSSILWCYYATKNDAKQIDHLFHFFEAFSEFMTIIMLSAFRNDDNFYKQQCHKWFGNDSKFKEWYLRATFGDWNYHFARLSKSIREYFGYKDSRDFVISLLGNPSSSFMSMLTSTEIVNILKDVAILRNKWKGHGGNYNEEENKIHKATLEQNLNGLRKFIADGFEETKLISPSTLVFDGEMCHHQAKDLIGARTPFKEITVLSLKPLKEKKLFLYHMNQLNPVELLPFIKFEEKDEAFYFYSSIESKNVRWISYHFDKSPELNQPIEEGLRKAFEFLKPNE